MKKYIAGFIVSILCIFVLLPAKKTYAETANDVFLYSDQTKDSYQGQSEVCITRDATFTSEDSIHPFENVRKITFTNEVEVLPRCIFIKFPNVEEIVLPEFLEDDGQAFLSVRTYDGNDDIESLKKLKKISIAPTNPYYATVDDILYSKDMSYLIYYPQNKQDKVYEMPEFMTSCRYNALNHNEYLQTLKIGARFDPLYVDFVIPNLKEYLVDEENHSFSVKDGVLFNADQTMLYAYPQGKVMNQYTIPETVKEIEYGAFYSATIDKLVLPSSLAIRGITDYSYFRDCKIKELEIHNNPYYETVDGVLYNKAKDELIYWPSEKVVTNLTFPSALKRMSFTSYTIPCLEQVTKITIPRDCEEFSIYEDLSSIKSIVIEKGNKYFNLYSDCLYSKDYKTLYLIPAKYAKTSITMHKNLDYVYYHASTITIPSVKTIIVNGIGDNIPFRWFPNLSVIKLGKNNTSAKVVKNVLYSRSMKKLIWYPQNKKDKSFTVPSTVTKLDYHAFVDQNYLQSVTLPKNLKEDYTSTNTNWFSGCKKLKEIKVASGNKYLVAIDGVLYSKDKSVLVCYPGRKTAKSYTLPEETRSFCIRMSNPYLTTIKLSKNLEDIISSDNINGFMAFTNLKKITVAKKNETYYSQDGVLYWKRYFITLYAYPMGKTDQSFEIPKEVTSVWCDESFENHPYLKEIKSLSPELYTVGLKVYEVVEGSEIYD